MEIYLFACVFVIFALVCFFFAFLLRHSQKSFEKDCQYTTAVIVGDRIADHSSYDAPRVRFVCDGKEVVTGAQSIRSRNRPVPGTQVRIAYKKGSFAGQDTWRVRIMKDGKAGISGYGAAVAMLILGIVFSLAAVYFLLRG